MIFAAFLLAYTAITSAILIAVVRMGEVLSHLETVLAFVRTEYPRGRGAPLVAEMPATGRIPHPESRRIEFQVQRTAELLLLVFMATASALQIVLAVVAISIGLEVGYCVLFCVLAVITTGLVATVSSLRSSRQTRPDISSITTTPA